MRYPQNQVGKASVGKHSRIAHHFLKSSLGTRKETGPFKSTKIRDAAHVVTWVNI